MPTKSRELLAIGIFGNSRVGDRIQTLLHPNRVYSTHASFRRVALSAGVLIALLFTASRTPRWIAFAQTPRPEFAVASVKPNQSGGRSRVDLNPGGMNNTNRVLAEYIEIAWNIPPWQVVHSPSISLFDSYDIEARAASPVPEAQVRLMLRALLEDRFKLAFHHETREVSAYLLTVAPGGPRFKPSESPGPRDVASIKDGLMEYRRTSILYLAGSVLSNMPSLGRPVVNGTGLDGIYDFALKLDEDPARSAPDGKGGTLQQLDNGLQESLKNLGLKLELKKIPIEYLVVDHVEKPNAN